MTSLEKYVPGLKASRILLENLLTFALVCIFSRICFSMRPIDIRAPDEARRIVAATISVFDIYLEKFLRKLLICPSQTTFM